MTDQAMTLEEALQRLRKDIEDHKGEPLILKPTLIVVTEWFIEAWAEEWGCTYAEAEERIAAMAIEISTEAPSKEP